MWTCYPKLEPWNRQNSVLLSRRIRCGLPQEDQPLPRRNLSRNRSPDNKNTRENLRRKASTPNASALHSISMNFPDCPDIPVCLSDFQEVCLWRHMIQTIKNQLQKNNLIFSYDITLVRQNNQKKTFVLIRRFTENVKRFIDGEDCRLGTSNDDSWGGISLLTERKSLLPWEHPAIIVGENNRFVDGEDADC